MELDKRLHKVQKKLDCIQNQLSRIQGDTHNLKHIAYSLSVIAYSTVLKSRNLIFADASYNKIRDQLSTIMKLTKW